MRSGGKAVALTLTPMASVRLFAASPLFRTSRSTAVTDAIARAVLNAAPPVRPSNTLPMKGAAAPAPRWVFLQRAAAWPPSPQFVRSLRELSVRTIWRTAASGSNRWARLASHGALQTFLPASVANLGMALLHRPLTVRALACSWAQPLRARGG